MRYVSGPLERPEYKSKPGWQTQIAAMRLLIDQPAARGSFNKNPNSR